MKKEEIEKKTTTAGKETPYIDNALAEVRYLQGKLRVLQCSEDENAELNWVELYELTEMFFSQIRRCFDHLNEITESLIKAGAEDLVVPE